MPESDQAGERVFRGIPVSPGVCQGTILVISPAHEHTIPRYEPAEADLPNHVRRLEQAMVQTRQQILEVQRKVSEGLGAEDAAIFDAHLLVLEDPTLIDEVNRYLYQHKVNVEFAFHVVAEKFADTLSAIEDEYLRERAADMRDVATRILNNLLGRDEQVDLKKLTEPCIIIGRDLSPSITAQFDRKLVLGFATDVGSRTSHTAIMARSLQIPAIVGLKNACQQLHTGQHVLLDGFNGTLIVGPTDQTLFEYGELVRKQVALADKLRALREQPAITMDGVRVTLSANIEQAKDTVAVQANGAEGVGLFRTEYLFINRDTPPTEEEQYQAYRQVAAALKPQPVIIRTLDLGGDKRQADQEETPTELNPFLGWRAIRYCLQERTLFRAQLRAILRASAEGNIKLMYPMISGLDELKQANAFVAECQAELRAENLAFDEAMEIGAMIEIPSAVLIAGDLAKHAKFFSIGTNDLIQYTLAVDRLNERVAHLYEPTHPAILRLIKMTVDAAHQHGRWVGVCGEMAGDPTLVPLLIGLGVDELSAATPLVPAVKYLIRRLKVTEARELADFAVQCDSSAEILSRSRALARQIAPSLFENEN